MEAFERRHWSKQKRVEAGKRPPGERARDFREIYLEYAAEEAVMIEAQRCLECKEPLCESACPLGNRIRDWLRLASEGKFLEAAAVSRETSNLPEICGRVCPQDRLCEEGCILVQKREPVSIGAIERFINMAFGFDASPVEGEDASKLKTNKWGNYEVDRIKMTSWPGVFAGGDIVRGADLVVTAIKDGREAARGIHDYLRGLPERGDAVADVLAAERGQV